MPSYIQIACPICKSSLREEADYILCGKCSRKFPQTNKKFINLFPEDKLKEAGFDLWHKRQSVFLGWAKNVMNESLAQEAKSLYDEFAQYIGSIEGVTLDIGCADGQLNNYFKKTKYIGIDPYEGWVINERPDYMKKIFPVDENNLIFVKGLGEYLPFADATFDNVIISNALDHSNHPYDMLREATRILRRNGRLYLMHENPALLNKLKRRNLGGIFRMAKRKLKGLIFTGTIKTPHIRLDKESLEGQLHCCFVFESKFSRNRSHMLYKAIKNPDNQ